MHVFPVYHPSTPPAPPYIENENRHLDMHYITSVLDRNAQSGASKEG